MTNSLLMKYKYLHIVCSALLLLGIVSCRQKEANPVVYQAPEVEFTMPSDVIEAKVGEAVTFSAKVVSGDKVSSGWYINDVLTSSSQTFEYVFEEAGEYQVRFEARNGAGAKSHDYTVHVADKLSIVLSVADSTVVTRMQLSYLQVAAIVEYGKNVMHEWRVDGTVMGEDAFFGSLMLEEARDYEISYRGTSILGEYEQSFRVSVMERPLEIGFSNTDEIIATLAGRKVTITATVLFGGSGLVQKWYVDEELVSETDTFSEVFPQVGEYTIRYEGENGVGEKVTRSWTVKVGASGRLFDDFEYEAIGPWFNLKENNPGIELVDNPAKDDVNDSDKCLKDSVYGSGGTSGYFTLKGPVMLSEAGFDISEYSGIRFHVYLGKNAYYPRVDYGGTKYPSVNPPKFNGGWEILEYRLPEGQTFDNTKNIQFRLLLTESGSNISGGNVDAEENNRTVYIDNIEFFKQ